MLNLMSPDPGAGGSYDEAEDDGGGGGGGGGGGRVGSGGGALFEAEDGGISPPAPVVFQLLVIHCPCCIGICPYPYRKMMISNQVVGK